MMFRSVKYGLLPAAALALAGLLTAGDFFQPYLAGDRARVVIVEDPAATDSFMANSNVVHRMVDQGIMAYTGEPTISRAWLSLVRTNDVVGIKVYSSPGRISGTRPVIVQGILEGLLAAGLAPQNIIIWDKRIADLGNAGFYDLADRYGVRVAGSTSVGWDEDFYYDNPLVGKLVWGDFEFGRKDFEAGRRSYVSRIVTKDVTRIINVSPMLNHNEARIAGNLYSLAAGSVDNFFRFEGEAMRLETVVPEINAIEVLGDRVAINIVDALVAQYEGGQRSLLHYAKRLNQIRISRDPVALDVLSVHDLNRFRDVPQPDNVRTNFSLFQNAALLQLGIADTNRIDVEWIRNP